MGWFAVHPPMQSLAISALILGITPLQPPTSPSTTIRQNRFRTHLSLILYLAVPLLGVGVSAMWWNKHIHGAGHFTTWHAWFGLLAIGVVVLQAAIGAAMSLYGEKVFGSETKAKKMYKFHRISGYLLVTLFLFTAHLGGAQSSWALGRGSGFTAVRVLAFWVGLPLIWVGLEMRTRPSKMKLI